MSEDVTMRALWKRTKLLLVQQTGLAEQELPVLTPMTERGEQVSPTNAVGSVRTTPRTPRRAEALALFAYDNQTLSAELLAIAYVE